MSTYHRPYGLLAAAAAGILAIATPMQQLAAVVPPQIEVKAKKKKLRRGYHKTSRLNRSKHWRRAASYKEARAMSPFPERPVR